MIGARRPAISVLRQVFAVGSLVVACLGCAAPASSPARTAVDPADLSTCDAAYRTWVDLAQANDAPGADVLANVVAGEAVQRRVFELCTLAEAERYNVEMPIEYTPGVRVPMIEPDFRTFADVECVDESPLLDGTPLCAEVGH